MTLFNESKYVQIKLCDLFKIDIYTLFQNYKHLHFNIFSQALMRPLTPAQCNRVLGLLDKGESAPSKSIGGHPHKLSPSDIQYAVHLITSWKAENATEVSKILQDMTNTSFTVKTVHWNSEPLE
jgi:hypothetical protein